MTPKIKYPKEGTKFYFIEESYADFRVAWDRFDEENDADRFYFKHFKLGNFFLKKKDAIVALKEIKLILRKNA